MQKKSIVVADDHSVFRQSIKSFLECEGFQVIAEAADGQGALRAVRKYKPDLAILDQNMPLMNGIATGRLINRRYPGTKVLLLTMYDDEFYVLEALRVGIQGYVMKHQAASDLIRALHVVSAGCVYLSPRISETVRKIFPKKQKQPAPLLSWRERQVLQLIAEGHSTKAMASLLDVSFSTAESHRIRIMHKLGIHNTAGLTCYAVRERIIRLEYSPET